MELVAAVKAIRCHVSKVGADKVFVGDVGGEDGTHSVVTCFVETQEAVTKRNIIVNGAVQLDGAGSIVVGVSDIDVGIVGNGSTRS